MSDDLTTALDRVAAATDDLVLVSAGTPFALRDKSKPCDAAEARALTAQIQACAVMTWTLIEEAYDRKAWQALNYPSFVAYCEAEFSVSKSRAYELLDLAKVARAIEAGAGCAVSDASETLTARDVALLKRDLPALEAAVTDAAEKAGTDEEAKRQAVEEAIRRQREAAAERTRKVTTDEIAPSPNEREDASVPPADAADAGEEPASTSPPPRPAPNKPNTHRDHVKARRKIAAAWETIAAAEQVLEACPQDELSEWLDFATDTRAWADKFIAKAKKLRIAS